MFEGQHSPTLILALFSRVFAQPQPDWPKQAKVTGFCFYDGHRETQIPVELARFLDDGPPPIVFTLGSSAVWVAREFFAESIEAAQRLGQRAVLLVGDERNRPNNLPDGMIAADYAPYQELMPRARVVVHHGGVGTTSQGLLAGVPTLIVPFAFDQSDNAEHAWRLGTSRTVYRRSYRADRLTKELRELLERPDYARNASEVSQKLKQENGPARAADLIEQVPGQTPGSVSTGSGGDRVKRDEELAYATGD
jgi:UDP:flavonoid glycosyltransferase YjiC (YdhE family)